MRRYLDFQCQTCGLVLEDVFTDQNEVQCPACKGTMTIYWQKGPSFADPYAIGIQKPPADFQKYVLGRIKDKHPNSQIERRRSIPREI